MNNGVAYVDYIQRFLLFYLWITRADLLESDYQIKHLKIEAPITKKGSSNLTKLVETEKILEHLICTKVRFRN